MYLQDDLETLLQRQSFCFIFEANNASLLGNVNKDVVNNIKSTSMQYSIGSDNKFHKLLYPHFSGFVNKTGVVLLETKHAHDFKLEEDETSNKCLNNNNAFNLMSDPLVIDQNMQLYNASEHEQNPLPFDYNYTGLKMETRETHNKSSYSVERFMPTDDSCGSIKDKCIIETVVKLNNEFIIETVVESKDDIAYAVNQNNKTLLDAVKNDMQHCKVVTTHVAIESEAIDNNMTQRRSATTPVAIKSRSCDIIPYREQPNITTTSINQHSTVFRPILQQLTYCKSQNDRCKSQAYCNVGTYDQCNDDSMLLDTMSERHAYVFICLLFINYLWFQDRQMMPSYNQVLMNSSNQLWHSLRSMKHEHSSTELQHILVWLSTMFAMCITIYIVLITITSKMITSLIPTRDAIQTKMLLQNFGKVKQHNDTHVKAHCKYSYAMATRLTSLHRTLMDKKVTTVQCRGGCNQVAVTHVDMVQTSTCTTS